MLQIKANGTTADVQSISYDPGVGLYVIVSDLSGDAADLEAALVLAVGGGPAVLEVQKPKRDKAK